MVGGNCGANVFCHEGDYGHHCLNFNLTYYSEHKTRKLIGWKFMQFSKVTFEIYSVRNRKQLVVHFKLLDFFPSKWQCALFTSRLTETITLSVDNSGTIKLLI